MATSTDVAVHWRSRHVAAALIDGTALLAPLALAIAAVVLTSKALPTPTGAAEEALWWIAIASVAGVVVFVTQRVARRLVPLSSLLRLSMAFPDQAPSRLNIAMRAGTVRDLEKRLNHVRQHGLDEEPARAAATILTLASALNAHDRRTHGHSERVRAYTDLLADEMGLSDDERDRLRWSALLHDIGKLEVGRGILNKTGPLDEHEWDVMHQHPEIGARVTEPLHDWLGEWSHAVDQHHENYDGSGYPHGLRGDEIAVGARIVAVADAFEVMTAMRSYKRPMDAAAARQELANFAGAQFDPAVVRAFLNISIGRLTWVMGPLTWLTSLRFVRIVRPASPVLRGLRNAAAVTMSVAVVGLLSAPSAGYKADADSLPAPAMPFTITPSMSPSAAALAVAASIASSPGSPAAAAPAVGAPAVAPPGFAAAGPIDPPVGPAVTPTPPSPPTSPPAPTPSTPPKPDGDHPAKPAPSAVKPDPSPQSDTSNKGNDGDDDDQPSPASGTDKHPPYKGNSTVAHDHSHDAECGNHGHWVSSHGKGC